MTDFDTQSAVKISPCPSEERMIYDLNAAATLSKTFVKNRVNQNDSMNNEGVTPVSDGSH